MSSSLFASIKMELILLFLLLLPLTSSLFTPNTTYFLNCGSSSDAVNGTRTFKPDKTYLSSTYTSTTSTSPSPNTSQLYSTVRVFTSQSLYSFETPSPSTYILRLHFLAFSSLASARFSVSALDRYLLLSNYSVTPNSLTIKEYLLWVDTEHVTLIFTPDGSDTAFISAIELFNAPDGLITSANPKTMDGVQATDIGHHGLETLYRVNVGGPQVRDDGDELWRSWSTDDTYIHMESVSFENATSVKIDYLNYGEEIAPQVVYQSARSMALTQDMRDSNNLDFNITWTFQVPNDYTYLIRMHFCDFISVTPAVLYFDVYLGDSFAYRDLHTADFTDNTANAAFYVDFASNPTSQNLLRLSIGRSTKNDASTANAILNGLEIMKLNNSGGSLDGGSFVISPKKHKSILAILISTIISGLILIAIIIVGTLMLLYKRRRQMPKSKSSVSWVPFSASTSTTNPSASPRLGNLGLHIPYSEIKIATNNFDTNLIVGYGGFGNVYKGVLRDGTTVAVKRGMPESKQGYPEFQTEIIILSTIRHRHLVSLIGYCEEQSEMILVYEYMEKGTLRSCLLGNSSHSLSWKQRLQICIGAARGLHYLHTGHSHNIIHRDVKSTNILLGENYLAKVSDFGLSRVGPNIEQTHVSTMVKGTLGYLDPEYFKTQKLTDKSDVYSFGVTLFEVLCGRAVIDSTLERDRINLAEWAIMWQTRGKIEKIVDPRIATEINANSLRTFGETAVKCLAEYSIDRPSIGDVLWNLEYALQLQETEVRREPHEDSGDVEVGIHSVKIRRVPSTMGVDENDDEDDMVEESWKPCEMGTSDVFSQLVTDEGR